MKFHLVIRCDNAAFDGDLGGEVARILRKVANRVEDIDDPENDTDDDRTEYDTNGNKCGSWGFRDA